MSIEDADEYVTEISQGSPSTISEFRITATSMEKAMSKIYTHKQSRKFGRYPMNIINRVQPSRRQVQNCEYVMGNGDKKHKLNSENTNTHISVPMFTCEGLMIHRKNGDDVVPVYFAYEDMMDDWRSATLDMKDSVAKSPNVSKNAFIHA